MSNVAENVAFEYATLSEGVKRVLREEFPQDTISTSEGYRGRVQVKIVSERFNNMTERQKQDFVWDLLRDRLSSDAQRVSFVLAYGTDEL